MPAFKSSFKYAVAFLIAAFLYFYVVVDINEELFFNAIDFAAKFGYPVESHVVESPDGYLITVHRIPRGQGEKKKDSRQSRPVVYIQHGLMCSSDVWLYKGPGKDLPFILADQGFDVWLGNSRGNYYARKHRNSSITNEEYWDFSWHEMGFYDLPAIINHILQETRQEKLSYIGHSMGSTIFLVMASTKPEYNSRINVMLALGPVARKPVYTRTIQTVFTWVYLTFGKILQVFGVYEIPPRSYFKIYFTNSLCKDGSPTQFICRSINFGLAGVSYEEYNSTLLSVTNSHNPAGNSHNQVLHFGQTEERGKFVQRDFGPKENLKRYNQTEPPEYDLSRVTAPVVVFYASNDQLAPAESVIELSRQLPNLAKLHKVGSETFNHLDYMWGLSANRLVYDDISKVLQHYAGVKNSSQYN